MLDQEIPVIRAARRNDIPELSVLIIASLSQFLQSASRHIATRYIESSRDIEAQWGSGEVLVVESTNELVGAGVYYRDAASLHLGLPAGWVSMRTLVVHPRVRGRGVGRLLVRHFVERARRDGAEVFALHTSAFMQTAIRIYEAAGFVRCPAVRPDRFEGVGRRSGARRSDASGLQARPVIDTLDAACGWLGPEGDC